MQKSVFKIKSADDSLLALVFAMLRSRCIIHRFHAEEVFENLEYKYVEAILYFNFY